jgi:hypothetical protein
MAQIQYKHTYDLPSAIKINVKYYKVNQNYVTAPHDEFSE